MKRLTKLMTIMLLVTFSFTTFNGCYGSFSLTKKLYNWNGSLGSKFVKTGVMWVLMIVPVYSACGFIDFVFKYG